MARLVYGLQQSLDGYVDHRNLIPSPPIMRYFTELVRGQVGLVYGRVTYEIMQYWDVPNGGPGEPEWNAIEHEFATIWRGKPKWVVSHSLNTVGPGATLLGGDLEAAIRALKDQHDGEIAVAGPLLAQSLGELGLIDEYRLYFHPVVLGSGTPFFPAPRPRLRLRASEAIGDDVIKLTYVPA